MGTKMKNELNRRMELSCTNCIKREKWETFLISMKCLAMKQPIKIILTV